MKILHLSASGNDGAGTAVRRLNSALNNFGVESRFIYLRPYNRASSLISPLEKKINGAVNVLIKHIVRGGSLNILPSTLLRKINESDVDIVHIHWINAEMLSIEQIAKIRKPVVWTFHDMWPICGIEHYVDDERFAQGRVAFSGLSRWVWNRKRRIFKRLIFSIATPGSWMTQCVQRSSFFNGQSCVTIANCLDLHIFRPMPETRRAFREKHGIPEQKQVLLFGAYNLMKKRKGGDLLVEAFQALRDKGRFVLLVFGEKHAEQEYGMETIHVGRVEGDEALSELYNCCDIALVPSRLETFGQTASEPQACGVPVVAFKTSGLIDVVEHKVSGYLAVPFDVKDFAEGIEWVCARDELRANARVRAERLFSESRAVKQYKQLYESGMSEPFLGNEDAANPE